MIYVVLWDYNYGYEDHANDVFVGVYAQRRYAVRRINKLVKDLGKDDPGLAFRWKKGGDVLEYTGGTKSNPNGGQYNIVECDPAPMYDYEA